VIAWVAYGLYVVFGSDYHRGFLPPRSEQAAICQQHPDLPECRPSEPTREAHELRPWGELMR
jgi:hypothetical protein